LSKAVISWTGASLPREVGIGSLLTSTACLGAGLVILEVLEAEVGFETGFTGTLEAAILLGVIGSAFSKTASFFLALPIGLR